MAVVVANKTSEAQALAQKLMAEINERAAKMSSEERAKADAETIKIAADVQRRIL